MTDSIQSSFAVNAAFSATEYGLIDETYPNVSETLMAAEAITFGHLVVWDVSGGADSKTQCRLPSTTGEVTVASLGVAAKDQSRRHGTDYAVNEPVKVLRRGRIRVQVDQTVVRGDPVFARFGAGGGAGVGPVGSFRKDADTNGAVQLPGASYVVGGTATTGAVIELNLPQGTVIY